MSVAVLTLELPHNCVPAIAATSAMMTIEAIASLALTCKFDGDRIGIAFQIFVFVEGINVR
jgi:hypothetical protein